MIIHVLFKVQIPGIKGIDDICLVSEFIMNQLQFVKFTWKIQILHEQVDLLPLAGEVDLVVAVPLGEVGLTR